MTVDLSKEELEIISCWYQSASGESASGLSVSPRSEYREEYKHCFDVDMQYAREVKSLLDKLGIEVTDQDEYMLCRVGIS